MDARGTPRRLLASPWWLAGAVALCVALRVAHVLALRATPWFDHLHVGIFQRDHPIAVEMRLRHLADMERMVGHVERAEAALHEAVSQCPPGCPWSPNDLFALYLDAGRAAEGAAWFETFVRTHPEQRDAPEYLARLRAAAGQPP